MSLTIAAVLICAGILAARAESEAGGTPFVIREGERWTRLENRKDVIPGSALDFSGQGMVDAPAGRYGWLKAVGGSFEFEGRPGRPQRFYGVNLCFAANYPMHEVAERLVDRFVRLGYNTIRVHHHDDSWAHRPEMRDRLDYLIAKAIEKGLYITTDLYVSRTVKWRDIGVEREGVINKHLYKTLVCVNDGAYADWCAFSRAFLEHVNPYTGRAYKDEPGMPLISLINEGALYVSWSSSKKSKDERLLAAWRSYSGESNAVEVASPWNDERARNFEDEINRRFYAKASSFVRALGSKALLTNDNCGARHGEGEGSTPLMDYVDSHFYVDHPRFPKTAWQLPSKCANENPVKRKQPDIFGRGYAKNSSKPYAITEWNFSGPGRYRALGGVLTGALAARDGWDGLWRFAYSHSREELLDDPRQTPGYFDCATDPLNQASDRASTLLFLRGDADGGTIVTDESDGSLRFASPRTCGGFAERKGFVAGPLTVSGVDVPSTIWVSTLDGKSIAESKRMLLVHLTDAQGSGAEYAAADRRVLLKWGEGCLIENGSAHIALSAGAPFKIYRLDSTGRRQGEVPPEFCDGVLSFDVSTANGCIYYELTSE